MNKTYIPLLLQTRTTNNISSISFMKLTNDIWYKLIQFAVMNDTKTNISDPWGGGGNQNNWL